MSNKDLYDLLKSSYKNQKEAKTDLADKYNYDDDLSTNKNKVVIDKSTGKPKIISRGSKTVRDWADNALIAVGLGKHAKGQKELQRSVKKVNEKYNQKPDIYSHSQASLFAENIPQKDKDQVYTVNKHKGFGIIGTDFLLCSATVPFVKDNQYSCGFRSGTRRNSVPEWEFILMA